MKCISYWLVGTMSLAAFCAVVFGTTWILNLVIMDIPISYPETLLGIGIYIFLRFVYLEGKDMMEDDSDETTT